LSWAEYPLNHISRESQKAGISSTGFQVFAT
jgi:hypothetical protein